MGVPWALLLAIAVVAGVEAYLHTLPRMNLIAYASDEGQYHAVRDTVEAVGPAEVALVGSSQMREGVVMSVLQARLDRMMRRHVGVANYAVRGARADVMDAEVRLLKRQPKPPRLIVVGLSPRDIRSDAVDWPRVAIFWTPHDWWAAFRKHRADALGVLPQVLRNVAGRALDTLRYREEIGLVLQRPFARFGVDAVEDGNPILGQETNQHQGSRGQRSLRTLTVPIRRLMDHAQDNYFFDHSARPAPSMRAALHDLVREFAAHPGSGLFVQMPVADVLQRVLDRNGQQRQYDTAVLNDTNGVGVTYVPVNAQDFRPTDDHFVDLQHLNQPGAALYSIYLADEIARQLKPRRPTTVP